jgi:hypothetical protein
VESAQKAPAADAAPDAATLDMPVAGSNPRDVVINPSGVPLTAKQYTLPVMPGLQRAVAIAHGHHGRHIGLRHPNHQRGHGKS